MLNKPDYDAAKRDGLNAYELAIRSKRHIDFSVAKGHFERALDRLNAEFADSGLSILTEESAKFNPSAVLQKNTTLPVQEAASLLFNLGNCFLHLNTHTLAFVALHKAMKLMEFYLVQLEATAKTDSSKHWQLPAIHMQYAKYVHRLVRASQYHGQPSSFTLSYGDRVLTTELLKKAKTKLMAAQEMSIKFKSGLEEKLRDGATSADQQAAITKQIKKEVDQQEAIRRHLDNLEADIRLDNGLMTIIGEKTEIILRLELAEALEASDQSQRTLFQSGQTQRNKQILENYLQKYPENAWARRLYIMELTKSVEENSATIVQEYIKILLILSNKGLPLSGDFTFTEQDFQTCVDNFNQLSYAAHSMPKSAEEVFYSHVYHEYLLYLIIVSTPAIQFAEKLQVAKDHFQHKPRFLEEHKNFQLFTNYAARSIDTSNATLQVPPPPKPPESTLDSP